MASPTLWTRVWANFRRWWTTEEPGVLQSTGSQRVRHDLATEQRQQSQRLGLVTAGWRTVTALVPGSWKPNAVIFCCLHTTAKKPSGFCVPLRTSAFKTFRKNCFCFQNFPVWKWSNFYPDKSTQITFNSILPWICHFSNDIQPFVFWERLWVHSLTCLF